MCYHWGLGDNYIEAVAKKNSGQGELLRGVLKPSSNFVKLGESSISQLNQYISF